MSEKFSIRRCGLAMIMLAIAGTTTFMPWTFHSAEAQMTDNKIVAENVGIADLKRGLADGKIILVDVRESNEWAAGHIPGAMFNPLSVFDVKKIPKEEGKRVVLQCRSGKRSLQALQIAQSQGRPDITAHFDGGMLAWEAAGEKTAR